MASDPRVFISYARTDGENFARDLRKRLLYEGISVWRDREEMIGGEDWWQQITKALEVVQYLVFVMTEEATKSPVIRKEWRFARQQGVCIFPVKAGKFDFDEMPNWMRDKHFYTLEYEWATFIENLRSDCDVPRVPFMARDLLADYVPRPYEYNQLIETLLNDKRQEPKAITTALKGAGGFGKTVLATALCHDERIQEAYDDGILWVTLGQLGTDSNAVLRKINELIWVLSGENPGLTDLETASDALADLLVDRDILFVIDDVWNNDHLRPFLKGGGRCTRLITTRNSGTLPKDAIRVNVDEMRKEEAINLLRVGLSLNHKKELTTLAKQVGHWPLLLSLANGYLRERTQQLNQPIEKALLFLSEELKQIGITALDTRDAIARDQAVALSLDLSLKLLSEKETKYFHRLAIFPEDVNIPFDTLCKLWGENIVMVQRLCVRFVDLSLLQNIDMEYQTVRLHDVVRLYIVEAIGGKLPTLHEDFLSAYNINHWADLRDDEPYMWDYLSYHLVEAGQRKNLAKTVKELLYLTKKSWLRKSYAAEDDLRMAVRQCPEDETLEILYRHYRHVGHLLDQCQSLKDVRINLCWRLGHIKILKQKVWEELKSVSPPYLLPYRQLPDLSHPSLIRSLSGHTSFVYDVAISSDGSTIVSGSWDNTVRVWDAMSGEVRHVLRGHTNKVQSIAICQDGNTIISGSGDNTVRVWDAESGEVRHILEGHTNSVNTVAINKDGNIIISGSDDKTVRVWIWKNGEMKHILEGHTDAVKSVAISNDGGTIVSGSFDNTVRVWDAESGDLRYILEGHEGRVASVAISDDGNIIVSGSWDKTVRVWDTESREVRFVLEGHTNNVRSVAIRSDGNFIVSSSNDNTVRVWDAKSGKVNQSLKTGFVSAVAISPDGDTLYTGSVDKYVRMWDLKSPEVQHAFVDQLSNSLAVSISRDGNTIVSGTGDNTVEVWDAEGGKLLHVLEGHTSVVGAVAISCNGKTIVSGSQDNTVRVWDTANGELRHTMVGHLARIVSVVISKDGSTVVSGSWDTTVRVWDAESGMARHTLVGHLTRVTSVAISLNGTIVSGANDSTVQVWDAESGELRHILTGHMAGVTSIVASKDGGTIVSGSNDNTARVWDAESGELRHILTGHLDRVTSVALSTNGDTIVSGSWDNTVRVWNAESGELRHTLYGHTNVVNTVTINMDGDTIASSSFDNTVRIWDAERGNYCYGMYLEGNISDVKWHPGGIKVIAGGTWGLYFMKIVQLQCVR